MPNPALSCHGDIFKLDGEPFQIVSGAVHYFRIHPGQWADRLQRLQWLGLNTVDVYVPWNFHEPHPEKYQFEDPWHDVVGFIELAAAHGFHVLLRPGPYIAAEWDFGGFPAWLLTEPELLLRSNNDNYQRLVTRWFTQLLPRLAGLQHERGGPIIAVQIENEYGTYGNDAAHLRWLAALTRSCGFDSLLFCNTGIESDGMIRGGSIPEILTTVDFDGHPAGPFELLERIRPRQPKLCSEHWVGWFDHWGERHHRVDAAAVADSVDAILANGASVNIYMAAGGTNFGWTAGATRDPDTGQYQPITTSYDYDAPIGEDGSITDKARRLHDVIAKHRLLPQMDEPPASRRLAPRQLTLIAGRLLFDCLDQLGTWTQHLAPVPMEQLGQHQGLVLYRTTITGPRSSQPLTLHGLGDYARVYLDGELVGTVSRIDESRSALDIAVTGEQTRLEVLVDATGRVNYGPHLLDPKGLSGPVLLGPQALFNWDVCSIPLASPISTQHVTRPDARATCRRPRFFAATCEIDRPADAHLALTDFGSALVWLNDVCIGRTWPAGQVRTLYAPSPLWRSGPNTVTVLSLDGATGSIKISPEPLLGD